MYAFITKIDRINVLRAENQKTEIKKSFTNVADNSC